MNRLYNKRTPLEKGVKIPYRKYLIFSCIFCALFMIMFAIAYSFAESSLNRPILLFAECILMVIYNIPINRLKNRGLLEQTDERSHFNHLKTIQVIAYTGFGGIILLMILTIRNQLPTFTISFFFLLIGFIFLLYAVIFYFYDKKGK